MIHTAYRYVYEVYKQKSVSAAAKALYISQPALSAAIAKAEKELGAPIFNRKTIPFSLTREGKVYMDAIEKMLQIEAQAAERIQDIRQVQGGTLRIATSTHISFYAIPRILEVFHRQHPTVDVNITVTDTDKLYSLLDKEVADLVFLSADAIPDNYVATELFPETFVVAVPADNPVCRTLKNHAVSHRELVEGTFSPDKAISDMSVFRGVEFIFTPPNSNIQKKRKLLFGKSDISPYITYNAGRQQLNYNLMLSGFGAFLTTDANIATMPPSDGCVYYALSGPASSQSFCIVSSDKEPSAAQQAFIDTAHSLFHCRYPLKVLIGQ